MHKELSYSDELRSGLGLGVKKLADAVRVTMGPRGRNVIIDKGYGPAHITKDGVTVAQAVHLEDPIERMGADLVKQVAQTTAEFAGDGTTTATVLANEIFQEGMRNVTAGANPISVKRGMDKARSFIVDQIKSIAKEVQTKDEIFQVATISANSDETIGNIIADAMEAVGNTGVITVQESNTNEDALEVVKGMKLESGLMSHYFCTDKEKLETVFENPIILLYNNRLMSLKNMVGLLEHAQKESRPLLIVVDDIDNDTLSTLAVNAVRGSLKVAVIKVPGVGQNKENLMEDLSVITGSRVVADTTEDPIKDVLVSDLGGCSRVEIDMKTTTFIDGKGAAIEIQNRIEELRSQNPDDEYSKTNIQKRLGMLQGGVAILKIGAPTEAELKEKKDRVDDALCATRAAVEEGIVIGGGAALIKCVFPEKEFFTDLSNDERVGAEIVFNACEAPIKQISENAGFNGGMVAHKVWEAGPTIGFDAANDEYVDMFEAGIVDPAKVERVALEQAVSIASLLLTSEAGIVYPNIKK